MLLALFKISSRDDHTWGNECWKGSRNDTRSSPDSSRMESTQGAVRPRPFKPCTSCCGVCWLLHCTLLAFMNHPAPRRMLLKQEAAPCSTLTPEGCQVTLIQTLTIKIGEAIVNFKETPSKPSPLPFGATLSTTIASSPIFIWRHQSTFGYLEGKI